jgi:Inhibitor of Apoptosis domain
MDGLRKRASLIERKDTFSEWEFPHLSPKLLAYAGFVKCGEEASSDAVMCVYCEKSLEGWRRTEVPVIEHCRHMHKCPLFNLGTGPARAAMFGFTRSPFLSHAIRELVRGGFFPYDVDPGETSLFCYSCGMAFRVSSSVERARDVSYILAEHSAVYPRCASKRGWRGKGSRQFLPHTSIGEDSLFFVKLISGHVDLETLPFREMDVRGGLCVEKPPCPVPANLGDGRMEAREISKGEKRRGMSPGVEGSETEGGRHKKEDSLAKGERDSRRESVREGTEEAETLDARDRADIEALLLFVGKEDRSSGKEMRTLLETGLGNLLAHIREMTDRDIAEAKKEIEKGCPL